MKNLFKNYLILMTITIGLLLSACNKVMDLGEDDPSAVTAAIYPKPGSYKTVIPVETALVEIPIHVSDGVVVERLEVNGGSCANAALEATKDGFVIRHSTAMGDTQPKEIDFTIVTSLNGKEYSYTYSYEVSVNTVTAHDVDILNNQNFGTSGILQLTGSDAASVELLSVRQTPKPLSTVCAANPIKIKNGGIWVDADFSGVCTTQYVLHVRKDGICQTITTPSRDFTVAPLVDIDVAPADLSFDIFTNKIVSYTGTDSALGALIYDNVTVSGCSAVNKTVSGNAITFGSDFSAGYSAAPCTANISFDVRSTSPLRLNTHKEFTFNITRKPVELQIPASADVFYKLPNGSHDISYTLLPTNATLSGAGQAPYTYDLLIGATGQVSASHFASGQKITVQNSDIYTHNKTQTIPYTFRAVYNSTTYNLPGTLTINYKYDPATDFELDNSPNPVLSNLSDSHTFNFTNVGGDTVKADYVSIPSKPACAAGITESIDGSGKVVLTVAPNTAPVSNCVINLDIVATGLTFNTNKKTIPVTVSTEPGLDFDMAAGDIDIYTYAQKAITGAPAGTTYTASTTCPDIALVDSGGAIGFKFDITASAGAGCSNAPITVTASKPGYTSKTKVFNRTINKHNVIITPDTEINSRNEYFHYNTSKLVNLDYSFTPADNAAALNGGLLDHRLSLVDADGTAVTSVKNHDSGSLSVAHTMSAANSKTIKYKLELEYDGNVITKNYEETINYQYDNSIGLAFQDESPTVVKGNNQLKMADTGVTINNVTWTDNSGSACADITPVWDGTKLELQVSGTNLTPGTCVYTMNVTGSKTVSSVTSTNNSTRTVSVTLAPEIDFDIDTASKSAFDIYTLHPVSFSSTNAGSITFDTDPAKFTLTGCGGIGITAATDRVDLKYDISTAAGACSSPKLTVTAQKTGYTDTQKTFTLGAITKKKVSVAQALDNATINTFFKAGTAEVEDLYYTIDLAPTDPVFNSAPYTQTVSAVLPVPNNTTVTPDAGNKKISASASSIILGSNATTAESRTVKYRVDIGYDGKTDPSPTFTSVINYNYNPANIFALDVNSVTGLITSHTFNFTDPGVVANKASIVSTTCPAGHGLTTPISSGNVMLKVAPNSTPIPSTGCNVDIEVVATGGSLGGGDTNRKVFPITVYGTQPMLDFDVAMADKEFDIYTYRKMAFIPASMVSGTTYTIEDLATFQAACPGLSLTAVSDGVEFDFDISQPAADCNNVNLKIKGTNTAGGYKETTKTFALTIHKKNITFSASASPHSVTYKEGDPKVYDIVYTVTPAPNAAVLNGKSYTQALNGAITVTPSTGMGPSNWAATATGGKVTVTNNTVADNDRSKTVDFDVDITYKGNTISKSYAETVNYVYDSTFNFAMDKTSITVVEGNANYITMPGSVRVDNITVSEDCNNVTASWDNTNKRVVLDVATGAIPKETCTLTMLTRASDTTTNFKTLTAAVTVAPKIDFDAKTADLTLTGNAADIYTLRKIGFTHNPVQPGDLKFDNYSLVGCSDLALAADNATDEVHLKFDVGASAGTCNNALLTVKAKLDGYTDTEKTFTVDQINKQRFSITQETGKDSIDSFFKIGVDSSHDLGYSIKDKDNSTDIDTTDSRLNGGAYIQTVTATLVPGKSTATANAAAKKVNIVDSDIDMQTESRTVTYRVDVKYDGKTRSEEFTSIINYKYDSTNSFDFAINDPSPTAITIIDNLTLPLNTGDKAYYVNISGRESPAPGIEKLTASLDTDNKVVLSIPAGTTPVQNKWVDLDVISSSAAKNANKKTLRILYTTTKPYLIFDLNDPNSFDFELSGHKDIGFDNNTLAYEAKLPLGIACDDIIPVDKGGGVLQFQLMPKTRDLSSADSVCAGTVEVTAKLAGYTDTKLSYPVAIRKNDYTITGHVAGFEPEAGHDLTNNILTIDIEMPERKKTLAFKGSPYGTLKYTHSTGDVPVVRGDNSNELYLDVSYPDVTEQDDTKNLKFKVTLEEYGKEKEYTYDITFRFVRSTPLPFDFADKNVRVVAGSYGSGFYTSGNPKHQHNISDYRDDTSKNYIYVGLDDNLDGNSTPEDNGAVSNPFYPNIFAKEIKLISDSCNANIENTELKAVVESGKIKLSIPDGADVYGNEDCTLVYRVKAHKYIDQVRDIAINVRIAPFLKDFKQVHESPFLQEEYVAVYMEVGDSGTELGNEVTLENLVWEYPDSSQSCAGAVNGGAIKVEVVENRRLKFTVDNDTAFPADAFCKVKVDFDATKDWYTNTHKTFTYEFVRSSLPAVYSYWHRNTEYHTAFRVILDEQGDYLDRNNNNQLHYIHTDLEIRKGLMTSRYQIVGPITIKGCSVETKTGEITARPVNCPTSMVDEPSYRAWPASSAGLLATKKTYSAEALSRDPSLIEDYIHLELQQGADFTGNWVELTFKVREFKDNGTTWSAPREVNQMKNLSVQTGKHPDAGELYKGSRAIYLYRQFELQDINRHADNKDKYYIWAGRKETKEGTTIDNSVIDSDTWIPIEGFNGIFEGRSAWAISGLTKPFFKDVDNATIRSLSFKASGLTSGSNTGLLANSVKNARLDSISVVLDGNISAAGVSNIGLIAGYADNVTASRLSVRGEDNTFKGDNNIGAFFGSAKDTKIDTSFVTANIEAGGQNAGSFIGAADNVSIVNAYNHGNIKAADYAGGFIGSSINNSKLELVYNAGSVDAGEGTAGGLVGKSSTGMTVNKSVVLSPSLKGGSVYRIVKQLAAGNMNNNFAAESTVIRENNLIVQLPAGLSGQNKEHGETFDINNAHNLFDTVPLNYSSATSTVVDYDNRTTYTRNDWIVKKDSRTPSNIEYLLPILGGINEEIQPTKMLNGLPNIFILENTDNAWTYDPLEKAYRRTILVDDITKPTSDTFQYEIFTGAELAFTYEDGTPADQDQGADFGLLIDDVNVIYKVEESAVSFEYNAKKYKETKYIEYKINGHPFKFILEYIPYIITPEPASGKAYLDYIVPVLKDDTSPARLGIALDVSPEGATVTASGNSDISVNSQNELVISNIQVDSIRTPRYYNFTLRVAKDSKYRDIEYRIKVKFEDISIEQVEPDSNILVLPNNVQVIEHRVKKGTVEQDVPMSISAVTAPAGVSVSIDGKYVRIIAANAQDNDNINVSYTLTAIVNGTQVSKAFSQNLTFVEIKMTPASGRISHKAEEGVLKAITHSVSPASATVSITVRDNGGALVSDAGNGVLNITANHDALVLYTVSAIYAGVQKQFDYMADVKVKKTEALEIYPAGGSYSYRVQEDPTTLSGIAGSNTLSFVLSANRTGAAFTITNIVEHSGGTQTALLDDTVVIAPVGPTSDGDVKTVAFDIVATENSETVSESYIIKITYMTTPVQAFTLPTTAVHLADSASISIIEAGISAIDVLADSSACGSNNGITAAVDSGSIKLSVAPGSVPKTTACAVTLHVTAQQGAESYSEQFIIPVTTAPKLIFSPKEASLTLYKGENAIVEFNYNGLTGVNLTNPAIEGCADIDITVTSGDKLHFGNTGAAGICALAKVTATASKTDYTDTTLRFLLPVTKLDHLLAKDWADSDKLSLSLIKDSNGKTFVSDILQLSNPGGSVLTLLGWDEVNTADPAFDVRLAGNTLTVRALKDHTGDLSNITIRAENSGHEKIYRFTSRIDIENGTTNPYSIDSFDSLVLMNAHADNRNKNYELIKDVSMAGKAWEAFDFTGRLDGKGHAVSDVILKEYAAEQGLFRILDGAAVTNLILTSSTQEKIFASSVGILAAVARNNTVIDNVTVKYDVLNVYDKAGGLVGELKSSKIKNSAAYGVISGQSALGGLAGEMSGSSEIINSYAAGMIEGVEAGGLVGNMINGRINKSYAAVKIHSGISGGIVGSSGAGSVIQNSIVLSDVIGSYSLTPNSIGLLGGNTASYTNNYVLQNMTARYATYIGGLGLIPQANDPQVSDVSRSALGSLYSTLSFVGRVKGNKAYIASDYLPVVAYEYSGSERLEPAGVINLPGGVSSLKLYFSPDPAHAVYKVNNMVLNPDSDGVTNPLLVTVVNGKIKLDVKIISSSNETVAEYTEYIPVTEADGSLMRPAMIGTKAQLMAINCMGTSMLVKDIDLGGTAWTGIAGAGINGFGGILDGNGFKIYGLRLASTDNQGLFKALGLKAAGDNLNPEIKSLHIEVSADAVQSNTGALAGMAYHAKLNGIRASGSLSGITADAVGGLVGYMDNTSIIYSSSAVDVNITNGFDAGGLAGKADNSLIHDSFFSGNVATGNNAGGIVGQMSNGKLVSVYSRGSSGNNTTVGVGGLAGAFVNSQMKDSVAANSALDAASALNRLAGGTCAGSTFINNYALSTLGTAGTSSDNNGADVPGGNILALLSGLWGALLWDFAQTYPELRD